MAVNMSIAVYLPCQELFGRPVTVNPKASIPGGSAYQNRGIFDSGPVSIDGEDASIISDQDSILDIRDDDYSTLPEQGDEIEIDEDPASLRHREGVFMVANRWYNGGGEITLQLKKIRD